MKSSFSPILIVIPIFLFGLPALSASAQRSGVKDGKQTDKLSQRDHIPYDDSTLTSLQGPYAMPYNRWIDPARLTPRFCDPKLANRTPHVVHLPATELLI